ncbi:MAG: hypothetical protein AAGG11_25040 [Pseudomonadota bacterium]
MTPPDPSGSRALLALVERALEVPHGSRARWLAVHCPPGLLDRAQLLVARAGAMTAEQEATITRVVGRARRDLAGQQSNSNRDLEETDQTS